MTYFSSAGILPFFLKKDSHHIANKLNSINEDIKWEDHDYLKEQFSIFSIDFNKDPKTWVNVLSKKDRDMLERYYDKNIKKEHYFLRKKEITPNYMVKYLHQKINFFDKKKNYSKFNAILGIEAINSKVYEDTKGFYHESNFSVFAGSRDKGEKNIRNVAIRECREEGKIVFDDTIFSIEFQTNIRKKYRISIPNCINIPLNETRTMKVFIMFIDDFHEKICEDENGEYLYISPYKTNHK